MARGNPDYMVKTAGMTERGYPIAPAVIPHIWLHDDFESPALKWMINAGTLALTTKRATDGTDPEVISDSCSLIAETNGAGSSQVRYDFAPPVIQGKVGFAYKFYVFDYDNISNTIGDFRIMQLVIDSYGKAYRFIIAYRPSTYKWYLTEDDGTTWTEFATCRLRSTSYSIVKLIVDFDTNKYDRFFVDGKEFDISSYTLEVTDTASGGIGRFIIQLNRLGATPPKIIIDDFIITIYEA